MTFRTNQPGSALASLSAFLEQSMQNRAMDLRKIPRVSSWRKSPGRSTKGERQSRKGGRSLVLVLTETSLSNFHFWVVSLCSYLDWKKDKTSLSFNRPDGQRYFFRRILWINNSKKERRERKAHMREGGPTTSSFRGGDSNLPTGREVHLTHLPTHQSRCSADLHW